MFGFPTQLSMIVEGEKSRQRAELTKEKLIGDWIGVYEYDSTYMSETTHIKDSATIRFDSLYLTLYDFRDIDSLQLKMEFDYEFGGQFHSGIRDDWRNQYDFWIRNLTSDSLDIILTQSLDNYFFKLIKIPPNN